MSSIADRKAEALATLARAREKGDGFNDWRGLAEELAALLATPAKKAKPAEIDKAAWADYAVPRSTKTKDLDRTIFTVTFKGEPKPVCFSCDSLIGRPYNWGRATRIARAYYTLRVAIRMQGVRQGGWCGSYLEQHRFEKRVKVPPITSIECNGVEPKEIRQP